MRLIDADALEDYIESDESGLMSAREFQRDYIECINEMPTIFDLDTVDDIDRLLQVIQEWNLFKKMTSMDIVGEACRRYTPREPHSFITHKAIIKHCCPTCREEKKRRQDFE